MCGILAVLGCSDDSQAKRVRVLELSRRKIIFLFFFFFPTFHFLVVTKFNLKLYLEFLIMFKLDMLKGKSPTWRVLETFILLVLSDLQMDYGMKVEARALSGALKQ
ncbi:hypothetical protein DITRI_Ditri14bG0053300 [Diplodiscus trichospermus]